MQLLQGYKCVTSDLLLEFMVYLFNNYNMGDEFRSSDIPVKYRKKSQQAQSRDYIRRVAIDKTGHGRVYVFTKFGAYYAFHYGQRFEGWITRSPIPAELTPDWNKSPNLRRSDIYPLPHKVKDRT